MPTSEAHKATSDNKNAPNRLFEFIKCLFSNLARTPHPLEEMYLKVLEEMKNYKEMTDGQINWKVHHIVSKGTPTCIKDYCNDVSVAWPIIIENKISMAFNWEVAGLWTAFVARQHYESTEENPLRAAMICFLKMKDAEAETNV